MQQLRSTLNNVKANTMIMHKASKTNTTPKLFGTFQADDDAVDAAQTTDLYVVKELTILDRDRDFRRWRTFRLFIRCVRPP